MRITKRQLRKIITEEVAGTSAQLMTDEQLMQEGLLDFLGGLFKKMSGALKKVVTAGVKALNPGKEANTYVAKAAKKISKETGQEINAKTIDELNLEFEDHARVLGLSQVPYSKVVSAEALDLFKQADAVKDWTPKSDSEEDNDAWMNENEEGITALMKAAGTVLGMLRYYYDEIDLGGGERISQFQKAADSFPDPDPAAVCKWTMDACEKIAGFFSMDEAKPLVAEYVKIYKAAEAIGKKVAASAKEQQKEWAAARRAVGEILNEGKVKITRRQLRKIIAEEIAHPRHGLGKNIADADFPIVVGYGDRSEIAYDQEELDSILDMITGGPGSSTNIPYSLDSLEDMEPKDRPVGADIERFSEGKVKIKKSKVRELIKEAVLKESFQAMRQQRADLLKNQYEEVSSDTRYPYGKNRGDVRRTTVYKRKDGQPVPDADFQMLKDHDKQERIEGGMMAALSGINTTTVSDDGLTLTIKYYRHTAG